MARPRFHLLTSVPLAAGLYRRWGMPAAGGVFLGGLLIDADHLADYLWTRVQGEKSHYLAPFHGWELAAALTLLAGIAVQRAARAPLPDHVVRPAGAGRVLAQPGVAGALVGIAAGMWLHLGQDLATNRPRHAGVYSLLYRLHHGFRRDITGWHEGTGFHSWTHLPWYRWYRAL